jgi:cobalt-zinc-cadmium efflux system protein
MDSRGSSAMGASSAVTASMTETIRPHDHTEEGHGHRHSPSGGHAHHHPTPPSAFDRAFAIGAALNAGFVAAEIIFSIAALSIALLADAAHNCGDVLGVLLAWGATWLARRRPTRAHTYGYGRSSIPAALTNAVVLLIGVGAIAVEALRRFSDAGQVGGITVMAVAAIGILVNGGIALLFARGRKSDLNVRGAFLHMAADGVLGLGVVISGLVIFLTGWAWLDPVASLAIALVITVSTWSLLRDSVNLALDRVPEGIDRDAVESICATCRR